MSQVVENLVAIEPKSFEPYEAAIESSGGVIAPIGPTVGALVWTDYARPDLLKFTLQKNPQLKWVQLPFAGVDAFADVLHHPVRFTSAKGSYREPVAEHALMLAMALGRKLADRARATEWGKKFAVSLYDSKVLIVGGGGITEELLILLAPFRADITVVRNRPIELAGATRTVTFEHLAEHLPNADFVILACALTDQTHQLFNRKLFATMKPTSYLVNIARGSVIHTDDLVEALNSSTIAGAAVDVTDPEPLPSGHPLWSADNILITPHTADTMAQVTSLFSIRLRENVAAYLGNGPWVGEVNPTLGY